MIVDPQRGLYVVLDGMGGANAGDIASQTARDAIRDFVHAARGSRMEPKALLEAAIQCGSAAVFARGAAARASATAWARPSSRASSSTPSASSIAHVGDSRAYLLRDGRLQSLTRDHTIVEELVDRGVLSAEEAERHPYKNVLSRNLGARPETRVDMRRARAQAGRSPAAVLRRPLRLRLGRGDAVPARLGRRARERRARSDRSRAARRRRRQRLDDRDRGAAAGADVDAGRAHAAARPRGGRSGSASSQIAKERGITEEPDLPRPRARRGARSRRAVAVPGDLPRPREVDRRQRLDVRAEPRRRLVRARRRVAAAARPDGHPRRRARAPSSTRSAPPTPSSGSCSTSRCRARSSSRSSRSVACSPSGCARSTPI